MKFIHATWFTEMGRKRVIGVVVVEIDGEQQAYIGTSRSDEHHTYDELQDVEWIAKHGASFPLGVARFLIPGYPLKAGQLTYDCRYSTMHRMPVTGGRGFRSLKLLWYNSVPP